MGGRTADQVRKQLTDQKAKTRAKAATINREMQKTGGGSAQCVILSAIEELLLASMNPQTLDGIIKNGDTERMKKNDTNLRGQSPSETG